MIGTIDVEIQAHNPSMPLYPIRAFEGSPSSIRIRNVPKKIGTWSITKIYFSVTYPDNTTHVVECKHVGGVYVGTITGCNTVGNVQNGYSIYADGVDENGNAVTNYCLGKGDIQILDARGITEPLKNTKFVQILSSEPATPNEGDMWQTSGAWYVWQDGEAWAIGDDSGRIDELSAALSTKLAIDDFNSFKTDELTAYALSDDVKTELSGKADKSQLASYELKADLQNDVSNIVTAREFTDWNYPEQVGEYLYAPDFDWVREHGDTSKLYYAIEITWNGTGSNNWLVVLYTYAYDSEYAIDWQPVYYLVDEVDAPEDTLELNCTFVTPEQETLTFHLTRENINVLGLAMMSDLQTVIPQDESNALANYTEDEYKTKVTFNTDTANVYRTQIFDWQGEVNSSMLSDLELSTVSGIKFGHGVSAIADGAFQNIGTSFHEVYFSDSLRRIGISAFAGNAWLYKVVYGDDTPRIKYDGNYAYNKNKGGALSIGDSAFKGCTQLGQAILPDIDKLTVGENVFTGCNFRYNDIVNGQMIHAAGIFFRNFYNKNNLEVRLDAHNLSAEKAAGICHTYIPATVYDIDKAGQENDSKYLGTYADAKFSVTARGANLSLSASVVNNLHISADPGSNRTKNINLPVNLTTDHSPRSLTVDLSVDAGVTFAGTVNKTTTMDWYLDGTMEQYRNEFLSAGVEVLWKFWEYKPNMWCAKKLGVR